jgi:hypothetical protein
MNADEREVRKVAWASCPCRRAWHNAVTIIIRFGASEAGGVVRRRCDDLLKTTFFILSIVAACAALYYFGMCVQSVDYHDGAYHPIPRDRYVFTFVLSAVASRVFWKLSTS